MRRSFEPGVSSIPVEPASAAADEPREIIVPHDLTAGPVTAVKNVILQSSLEQLRTNGHYERYVTLIAPNVLEELLASIGPGWSPVELAVAHYEACEGLGLSHDQTNAVGMSVGERLQSTSFVTRSKKVRDPDFDVWSAIPAMFRMWPRLYQGGSVQCVKVGPKTELIEQRGFPMNSFQYFRQAQLAAFVAAFEAIGAELSCLKLDRYNAAQDELVFRVIWY